MQYGSMGSRSRGSLRVSRLGRPLQVLWRCCGGAQGHLWRSINNACIRHGVSGTDMMLLGCLICIFFYLPLLAGCGGVDRGFGGSRVAVSTLLR